MWIYLDFIWLTLKIIIITCQSHVSLWHLWVRCFSDGSISKRSFLILTEVCSGRFLVLPSSILLSALFGYNMQFSVFIWLTWHAECLAQHSHSHCIISILYLPVLILPNLCCQDCCTCNGFRAVKNPVRVRLTCLQTLFQHLRWDNGGCGVWCNLTRKYLLDVFDVGGFCGLIVGVPP